MDKQLHDILEAHVAQGEDTTNKLLGAAFALVNKDGRWCQFHPQKAILTHPRPALLWQCRPRSHGSRLKTVRHGYLHLDRLCYKAHHLNLHHASS